MRADFSTTRVNATQKNTGCLVRFAGVIASLGALAGFGGNVAAQQYTAQVTDGRDLYAVEAGLQAGANKLPVTISIGVPAITAPAGGTTTVEFTLTNGSANSADHSTSAAAVQTNGNGMTLNVPCTNITDGGVQTATTGQVGYRIEVTGVCSAQTLTLTYDGFDYTTDQTRGRFYLHVRQTISQQSSTGIDESYELFGADFTGDAYSLSMTTPLDANAVEDTKGVTSTTTLADNELFTIDGDVGGFSTMLRLSLTDEMLLAELGDVQFDVAVTGVLGFLVADAQGNAKTLTITSSVAGSTPVTLSVNNAAAPTSATASIPKALAVGETFTIAVAGTSATPYTSGDIELTVTPNLRRTGVTFTDPMFGTAAAVSATTTVDITNVGTVWSKAALDVGGSAVAGVYVADEIADTSMANLPYRLRLEFDGRGAVPGSFSAAFTLSDAELASLPGTATITGCVPAANATIAAGTGAAAASSFTLNVTTGGGSCAGGFIEMDLPVNASATLTNSSVVADAILTTSEQGFMDPPTVDPLSLFTLFDAYGAPTIASLVVVPDSGVAYADGAASPVFTSLRNLAGTAAVSELFTVTITQPLNAPPAGVMATRNLPNEAVVAPAATDFMVAMTIGGALGFLNSDAGGNARLIQVQGAGTPAPQLTGGASSVFFRSASTAFSVRVEGSSMQEFTAGNITFQATIVLSPENVVVDAQTPNARSDTLSIIRDPALGMTLGGGKTGIRSMAAEVQFQGQRSFDLRFGRGASFSASQITFTPQAENYSQGQSYRLSGCATANLSGATIVLSSQIIADCRGGGVLTIGVDVSQAAQFVTGTASLGFTTQGAGGLDSLQPAVSVDFLELVRAYEASSPELVVRAAGVRPDPESSPRYSSLPAGEEELARTSFAAPRVVQRTPAGQSIFLDLETDTVPENEHVVSELSIRGDLSFLQADADGNSKQLVLVRADGTGTPLVFVNSSAPTFSLFQLETTFSQTGAAEYRLIVQGDSDETFNAATLEITKEVQLAAANLTFRRDITPPLGQMRAAQFLIVRPPFFTAQLAPNSANGFRRIAREITGTQNGATVPYTYQVRFVSSRGRLDTGITAGNRLDFALQVPEANIVGASADVSGCVGAEEATVSVAGSTGAAVANIGIPFSDGSTGCDSGSIDVTLELNNFDYTGDTGPNIFAQSITYNQEVLYPEEGNAGESEDELRRVRLAERVAEPLLTTSATSAGIEVEFVVPSPYRVGLEENVTGPLGLRFDYDDRTEPGETPVYLAPGSNNPAATPADFMVMFGLRGVLDFLGADENGDVKKLVLYGRMGTAQEVRLGEFTPNAALDSAQLALMLDQLIPNAAGGMFDGLGLRLEGTSRRIYPEGTFFLDVRYDLRTPDASGAQVGLGSDAQRLAAATVNVVYRGQAVVPDFTFVLSPDTSYPGTATKFASEIVPPGGRIGQGYRMQIRFDALSNEPGMEEYFLEETEAEVALTLSGELSFDPVNPRFDGCAGTGTPTIDGNILRFSMSAAQLRGCTGGGSLFVSAELEGVLLGNEASVVRPMLQGRLLGDALSGGMADTEGLELLSYVPGYDWVNPQQGSAVNYAERLALRPDYRKLEAIDTDLGEEEYYLARFDMVLGVPPTDVTVVFGQNRPPSLADLDFTYVIEGNVGFLSQDRRFTSREINLYQDRLSTGAYLPRAVPPVFGEGRYQPGRFGVEPGQIFRAGANSDVYYELLALTVNRTYAPLPPIGQSNANWRFLGSESGRMTLNVTGDFDRFAQSVSIRASSQDLFNVGQNETRGVHSFMITNNGSLRAFEEGDLEWSLRYSASTTSGLIFRRAEYDVVLPRGTQQSRILRQPSLLTQTSRYVLPWVASQTTGIETGVQALIRISNPEGIETGALRVRVRAGTGEVSESEFVEVAAGVPAYGEVVLDSQMLEESLGDFGRGDIEIEVGNAGPKALTLRYLVIRDGDAYFPETGSGESFVEMPFRGPPVEAGRR